MNAKQMRDYQKEQRQLKEGEYAVEYKNTLLKIQQAVQRDPSIDYVDIDDLSKPVVDRLKADKYELQYITDQRNGSYYRVTWDI